jgi:small-conductance mechanosensitive channel
MGAQVFGYVLVALSAVLLAQLWQQARELKARRRDPRDLIFARFQLQRRVVASALIGVIGAAMTIADRVPRRPLSLTLYLFAMLLGGVVILAFALADWRSTRRRREVEHLDLVVRELQKLQQGAGTGEGEAREA